MSALNSERRRGWLLWGLYEGLMSVIAIFAYLGILQFHTLKCSHLQERSCTTDNYCDTSTISLQTMWSSWWLRWLERRLRGCVVRNVADASPILPVTASYNWHWTVWVCSLLLTLRRGHLTMSRVTNDRLVTFNKCVSQYFSVFFCFYL